jgi:CheY-like chemotaxis protein
VASAEGQGSRFAAWLPLRTPAQAIAAVQQRVGAVAKATTGLAERFALVVEDDDQAANMIRLLLVAEGFTVLRAASAEDALVLAPLHSFSLVTLDLMLPGMSGWEFLQTIKDRGLLEKVPVMVLTVVAESDMAPVGAAIVLQKPVSRSQLSTALAGLGLQPNVKRAHTVMVVDDDPKAVEVIATFLPPPTYAVVRAFGGSQAILLAQQLRPDLILLDLMMPEVNGFDVVNALQQNSETAKIPILVVTAKHITAEDRLALSRNPANPIHIVEKAGFNHARFVAEVQRILPPN